MNFRKRFIQRRNAIQEIEFQNRSGSHINCVRINPHNSHEHELTKFLICEKLIKDGYEVITEAKFTGNRGICDILAIKDEVFIIEVLNSETEVRLNQKRAKYPDWINIVPIRSKGFKIDEFSI